MGYGVVRKGYVRVDGDAGMQNLPVGYSSSWQHALPPWPALAGFLREIIFIMETIC